MFTEQRDALNDIITKIRGGRMTRRTFVERALALGIAGDMVTALLEACSSGAVVLSWQAHNLGKTYNALVQSYNEGQGQKDGIYVYYIVSPISTDTQHDKIKKALQAGTAPDLLSLDIIWLAELHQWLRPIGDDQWSKSERARYLPGPIAGCTFEGQLWAVPFLTDVGILYYRTQMGATPPATWQDLAHMAEDFQLSGKTKYGYVWQGASYEGLVCNFVEVLYSYGGSIFAPDNPRTVTVTEEPAVQALTEMVSWVDRASPSAVLTYKEEDARAVWQQGYAAFMRNWPSAYSSSLGKGLDDSQVINSFDICALPFGGNNSVGHACIGGWQLGINQQSKYPEQAWMFIQYVLEQQRSVALQDSIMVTLQSVYDDEEVRKQNPLFGNPNLKSILQNAMPRPVSVKYPDVTKAIQKNISQALSKNVTPLQALSALQSDLQQIITSS